jgi:hypothetical protein
MNPADFFSDAAQQKSKERGDELEQFLKCVKGNPRRFFALCAFGHADGADLDPGCCAPINDGKLVQHVLYDALHIIISDRPVNGKEGNWSNGFMGSRWLDMDAKKYGLDYIRLAFYSKKNYQGKTWRHEKPYAISVTMEKARR